MMLTFLAWLVIVTAVAAHDGLSFDYLKGYASGYNNYQPRDYHFDYHVSDPHTGDHKSQWEVKENGVVRGGYSLLEPDGSTRIVEYVADEHGFRAVVKKIGLHSQHIETHGNLALPASPEVYNSYDGTVENYNAVVELPQPSIEIHHGQLESRPIKTIQDYAISLGTPESEPVKVEPLSLSHQVSSVEPVRLEPLGPSYHVPQSEPVRLEPLSPSYHVPQPEPVRLEPLSPIHQVSQPEPVRLEPLGPSHQKPHLESASLVPVSPSYQTEVIFGGSLSQTPPPFLEDLKIPIGLSFSRIADPTTPPPTPLEDVKFPVGLTFSGIASPSYSTVVEYHGLTGNQGGDEYHAAYSEKVANVVSAPPSRGGAKRLGGKRQFLIYYPESE